MNPSRHVRVIRETRFGGNGTKAIGSARDSKPRGFCSEFCAKYFRGNAIGLRKAARHRFRGQPMRVCPISQLYRRIANQIIRQLVRPIVALSGGNRRSVVDRVREKFACLEDIFFGDTYQFVQILQAIESACAFAVEPLQSDQLDSRRGFLVFMSVELGMNKYIAGGGAESTRVARFFKCTTHDDGRISAKMPMARHRRVG